MTKRAFAWWIPTGQIHLDPLCPLFASMLPFGQLDCRNLRSPRLARPGSQVPVEISMLTLVLVAVLGTYEYSALGVLLNCPCLQNGASWTILRCHPLAL
jgi:hypothetical protein